MSLVLVSVVLLLLEFYLEQGHRHLPTVILASEIITVIFIIELSLRWFAAPSTRAHWREYWLDWLAVIPFFRPVRLLRAFRILRFARAFRLLRLYRLGILAHRFAHTFDPRRFDDALRESLAHYQGPHADLILLAPDLYAALGNLLEDGRVHNEARALVCQGMAYFITPYDVFPEETYGSEGYLDDVFLALWVLNRLKEELPEAVLERAWRGEEHDFTALVEDCLHQLERVIPLEDRRKVLRYVGLEAPPPVPSVP
jgi:uncharacterized membrane protein YkvA (DUF1232 family)